MLRVTADSNIYISALLSRQGSPSRFLALARAGSIRLAVSEAILDEVADVLTRKFDWPPEGIAEVRDEIGRFTQKVKPAVSLDVVKDDPDDNKILECAVSSASELIVTGDKDLLRIQQYDSIRIITVTEFFTMGQRQERER